MTKDEALKLALEALENELAVDMTNGAEVGEAAEQMCDAIAAIKEALAQPEQEPMKLWLWKNFVNGKPEYWAFDNPFPCMTAGGDPLTLGEPCGWALFKTSVNGRPNRSEQEVIDTVMRLSPLPDAFEQGRQEGMKQERALWTLTKLGQEIEAQPEEKNT